MEAVGIIVKDNTNKTEWQTIGDALGVGSEGAVYCAKKIGEMISTTECHYVLKLVNLYESDPSLAHEKEHKQALRAETRVIKECRLQNQAAKLHIAMLCISVFVDALSKRAVLVTQSLQKIPWLWIGTDELNMILKTGCSQLHSLVTNGLVKHNDAHYLNIMWTIDRSPRWIDFGNSRDLSTPKTQKRLNMLPFVVRKFILTCFFYNINLLEDSNIPFLLCVVIWRIIFNLNMHSFPKEHRTLPIIDYAFKRATKLKAWWNHFVTTADVKIDAENREFVQLCERLLKNTNMIASNWAIYTDQAKFINSISIYMIDAWFYINTFKTYLDEHPEITSIEDFSKIVLEMKNTTLEDNVEQRRQYLQKNPSVTPEQFTIFVNSSENEIHEVEPVEILNDLTSQRKFSDLRTIITTMLTKKDLFVIDAQDFIPTYVEDGNDSEFIVNRTMEDFEFIQEYIFTTYPIDDAEVKNSINLYF